VDQLLINMEMTCRILQEDLLNKICTKFVPHYFHGRCYFVVANCGMMENSHSNNKEKVIMLNFTWKNQRPLLRANPLHVNVIWKQRNIIVAAPSPHTFCSGGRFLF
jgi:hypothetical protein